METLARTPGRYLALASVAALYCWWATGLRPFTLPALLVTLGTGLTVVVVGSRLARRSGREPVIRTGLSLRPGLVLWALVLTVLVAGELAAYVQHPRAEHPTLSSLANQVFGSHAVRASAFGLWVAAGVAIVRR